MTNSSVEGKSIMITGANSGIGKALAHVLALGGARLFLACRSQRTAMPAIKEILEVSGNDNIFFLPLDLENLGSIRACVLQFLDRKEQLNILINNAGVAGLSGQTRQGFELQFGVNHLGHFLLTNLLLDTMMRSTPARIINISSRAHFDAKAIDFDALQRPTQSYTGLAEYSVSKLCNVLHAKELARRLEGTGVTTYSLHPGVVASNIWRRLVWPIGPMVKSFMKPPEEGIATPLFCATAPEIAAHSGRYYDDCKEREPSKLANDAQLAAELWERSEEWTRSRPEDSE